MATTDFIAAIELGSSKITGIAGRKNSDGSMQVLAYATEDSSSFIRKGVIYNLDKTAQSLNSIINKLEGLLYNSIGRVYVGIGGQSLCSVKNVISRTLPEDTIITQELIDEIFEENCAIPYVDKDILEVVPQEYKIGNNLQADPVGVTGSSIEGRFLNIVARSSVKKNLERSFEQGKVEIADLLIAPIVTANAVLTESEKRSGCALVDFGADTTTISIYKNNILRHLTVIPLGGNNITRDITSLQVEEEEAENLKIKYGDALYEEAEGENESCKLDDGERNIDLARLNDIIIARTEEIIENVWNQIQLSGHNNLLAGIVLTGGGANLKNLCELFQNRTQQEKVKIVRTPHAAIYSSEARIQQKTGTQNTILGLLLAGDENCCLQEKKVVAPTTLFDLEEKDGEEEIIDTKSAKAPTNEKSEREKVEAEKRAAKEAAEKKKREEKEQKKNEPKKPGFFSKIRSMAGRLTDEMFEGDNEMK